MIISITSGVSPEIGKYYLFHNKGFLKIGLCINNPSKKPVYEWAMRELETGKVYYPYCADVFNLNEPVQLAVPTFKFEKK